MEDATAAGVGKRVLVVEDETLVALFLVDLIEDLGFAVLGPARDGAEAIELGEVHRPEIAIVDISVAAERDGLEIGAELVSRYGVGLIFISGHRDVAEMPEVQALAPVAVLKKPCLPNQIAEALMRAASRRDSG